MRAFPLSVVTHISGNRYQRRLSRMDTKNAMNRRRFLQMMGIGTASAALAACAAPVAPAAAPAEGGDTGAAAPAATSEDQLEIFSWWTAGGEVEALDAIYAIF